MKNPNGVIINRDKCLACKLFSAPLFFTFGAFFSYKNYGVWKETPKFGRYFLVLIPAALYAGGIVNTYHAYNIFRLY